MGGTDLSMSELSSVSIGPECSLLAPGRTALDLSNAELLSSLTLSGATVQGTTAIAGARIHGTLTLAGASLSQPQGKTLVAAQGALIEGSTDLQDLRAVGGRLRFSAAATGSASVTAGSTRKRSAPPSQPAAGSHCSCTPNTSASSGPTTNAGSARHSALPALSARAAPRPGVQLG